MSYIPSYLDLSVNLNLRKHPIPPILILKPVLITIFFQSINVFESVFLEQNLNKIKVTEDGTTLQNLGIFLIKEFKLLNCHNFYSSSSFDTNEVIVYRVMMYANHLLIL